MSNSTKLDQPSRQSSNPMIYVMGFLAVLLASYVGFQTHQSFQEQSAVRSYVDFSKKYFSALYGEENALSSEVDMELKTIWTDFAREHQGVKHLTLVTKVCEHPAQTPSLHHCNLSFQTHFNDGSSTMTFGMDMMGDTGEPITLEPLNVEGGTMLLTNPQPFTTTF